MGKSGPGAGICCKKYVMLLQHEHRQVQLRAGFIILLFYHAEIQPEWAIMDRMGEYWNAG